jgi:2-oxoisovalerate dehydrogenase E2 component (dihydrolipoyl transacylase)
MDFRLPELGEGVYEAELVDWLVKPGDPVKRGQNLVEVLTDKATMEVPSPFVGTIAALKAEPGQQIKVGDVILSYTAVGQADGATPDLTNGNDRDRVPGAETPTRRASEGLQTPSLARRVSVSAPAALPNRLAATATSVKAAPSIRYMARQLGIDLSRVPGSGPGGRVLIEDLSSFLTPTAEPKRTTPEPAADFGRPGTRIKLQGVRRKIAEHMVLAKHTIPHYSYVDECDVSELVRLRDSLRETYAQAGVKLTYLAFFIKAAVAALKDVPIVNASLDEPGGEIILHDHYHIGFAVSTPSGLIVPVIHDADRLDVGEIAQTIDRLTGEARAGKIRLDDLRGGTFTVTSIGNVGGLISTPIIRHPEVAILGIGKIVKRPVYDANGALRPADLLFLSLSFDHRVVDGAGGAAFGNALRRHLENPAILLLPTPLARHMQ